MSMNINQYLDQTQNFQNLILDFIENDASIEEDLPKWNKIFDSKNKLEPIMHLILSISNDHQHVSDFFQKIGKILLIFREQMKSNFSDVEIFNIFRSNKRILLFLFEEKIISISISSLEEEEYLDYFSPEISKSRNKKDDKNLLKNSIENFEYKRKIGENESYLSQLIRDDSVEEFVTYVNQTNLHLSTTRIERSIFETNSFLIDKKPTLIEYAAFFGSIQIFQFLRLNNVSLTSSLWLFAVHSNNADLIHLLEENQVIPEDKSYFECLKESIKCHHVNLTNYFRENFFDSQQKVDDFILENCFNFYNFAYFSSYVNEKFVLHYACQYNYLFLVNLLLESKSVDINSIIVFNIF